MKQIIHTSDAPAPIGPYSQAVRHQDTLYLSGQIALDPATGKLVIDTLEEETHQVMRNIQALLSKAGADLSRVIKTSIFLKNMDDFSIVNEVYGSYFSEDYPARETVEVSCLPKNVNVEISMIVGCEPSFC
jgi:2-iminobutanoate/2-iminopropanoate deaminase